MNNDWFKRSSPTPGEALLVGAGCLFLLILVAGVSAIVARSSGWG